MKKVINKKKILKKVLCVGIGIYVICILVNQQKTLNSYKNSQKYYEKEIQTKLAYKEDLNNAKANIKSEEYIEKVARETLDMYLPNERVYIDKGK